ncbi:MAG: DUF4380 domain-containing protein [Pseudoxanthomonas sp.]
MIKTCLMMLAACVPPTASAVETVRLQNDVVVLEITPALGGRGLSFSLKDHPNLLKLGAAVASQPDPEVSARADDIAYLGHDVWAGPQAQWWTHQDVNPARREAKANWPPDPYLALSHTRILERTDSRLVLEGVDSPVSGLRLRKTFQLSAEQSDTVEIAVSARNIRDSAVAWDLWFNTRTPGATRVYIPVASAADVRAESFTGNGIGPLLHRVEDGLFFLDRSPLPAGMDGRRGKVFVQPAVGWMAGFSRDQLFLIRFTHHPRSAIHPDQGQVELYLDDSRDPATALLEMEVHAPYVKLAPGAQMHASERWSVLPYPGADDPVAHAAFLCQVAAPRLRAPELCVTPKLPPQQLPALPIGDATSLYPRYATKSVAK